MVGANQCVWVAMQCVQFRCYLRNGILLGCKALAVLPSHCLALPSHCMALPSHCHCHCLALPSHCIALPSQCLALPCPAKPVPFLALPVPCLALQSHSNAIPIVYCTTCELQWVIQYMFKVPKEANGSTQHRHALDTGLISFQSCLVQYAN